MKQEERNLKKHKILNVSHPTLISRQTTVSNDSIDSNYNRTEVNQNKTSLLLQIIFSIHKHTTIFNQYLIIFFTKFINNCLAARLGFWRSKIVQLKGWSAKVWK
jgi:hypothetical protein